MREEGPQILTYPDHFFDVEGGISLIYWEEDRSSPCLASILEVEEKDETFTFRVFSWQGKKKRKKTFFDTGKDMTANEKLVWRLVHRTEFENNIQPDEIKVGQILRIRFKDPIPDFTGFVREVGEMKLIMDELTGYKRGRQAKIERNSIANIVEILSSPLFFRFRRLVSSDYIKWKAEAPVKISEVKSSSNIIENKKPRMLLSAPKDCQHKRSWHFWKLFPKNELEYCCNRAMEEALGIGNFVPFDAEAFFAA